MSAHKWTIPHYGVSHLIRDETQYTIIDRPNFVELEAYSWRTHRLISRHTFFVQSLNEKCHNDKWRLWNCQSMARAIQIAKHYAESGCRLVEDKKDDLTRLDCPELEL